MAIEGNTPGECFKKFVGHLNPLIQAVLPTKIPIVVLALSDDPTAGNLAFGGRDRDSTALISTIPLKTKSHGIVHFHLGQLLHCVENKKGAKSRYHLSTRKYWYRIQSQRGQANAIVRWEYVSPRLPEYAETRKRWCWRHVQMSHNLPMPTGKLDLNKAHLPTGYLVIEDVLRFLISDLGVRPGCDDWHERLLASEKRFLDEFNTKIKGA